MSGDFWPLSVFGWRLSLPESRSVRLTHRSLFFSDSAKREVAARAAKAPQEVVEVVKAPKVVDEAVKAPKVSDGLGSVCSVLWERVLFGPCRGLRSRRMLHLSAAGFPPLGVHAAHDAGCAPHLGLHRLGGRAATLEQSARTCPSGPHPGSSAGTARVGAESALDDSSSPSKICGSAAALQSEVPGKDFWPHWGPSASRPWLTRLL